MDTYEFKSTVISNEINLNQIAGHFGINKKLKWEEPLILGSQQLTGILSHPDGKTIYIFSFGSIVSINLAYHEIKDVISYIKNVDVMLKNNVPYSYVEDFKLIVDENAQLEINYNSIVAPKLIDYHFHIIATILAKSVALKKIEDNINILLDEIESIIEYLDKGHLSLSDNQLAKMSSKILRFKFNTISYIMLLDKPLIAWKNEEAEQFFMHLSELFELKDRYQNISHKTEVLFDTTDVFTSLTHAKRGTKLEWMVIILIMFELLVGIIDMVFKFTH